MIIFTTIVSFVIVLFLVRASKRAEARYHAAVHALDKSTGNGQSR